MASNNSKNKSAPTPAVVTATTTPSPSTASSSATPAPSPSTASSSPTPTPKNWAELVQTQGGSKVQSKKHPKYPKSPFNDLLTHGNNSYTRLLLISSNQEEDEKLVEGIRKDGQKKADKVEYFVVPIPKDVKNKKDEFITEVKKLGPTMVVLKKEETAFKGVLEALGESGIIEDWDENDFWQLTETMDGNFFYSAKNITAEEQENIIQAFTVVSDGRGVEEELKELLMQNKAIISSTNKTAKVLLVTGSHGGKGKDSQGNTVPFSGKSGLSDEENLNKIFYAEDCSAVGIVSNHSQFDGDADGDFLRWKSSARSGFNRDDIHTSTPLTPPPHNSLLNDPNFNQIEFQVVDLSNYHDRPDLRGDSPAIVSKRCAEFVKDVKAYNPTVICLSYCFSANGDIALALRSVGFYSEKIVEHELRRISGKPEATLHLTQLEVIRNVWKENRKHVVLVGNSGVGKTVLGAAAVKDGAAIIKKDNTETIVKIYVVCMAPGVGDNAELLNILKDKYFRGIEGIESEFCTPKNIAETLGLNYEKLPSNNIERIKAICDKAEKDNTEKEKRDGEKTVTIFMFDEVWIASSGGVADCTGLEDLAKLSSVRTVICISPQGYGAGTFTISLPATIDAQGNHTAFYCKTLTVLYRNTENIRSFNNFMRHSRRYPHLSRENDSLGDFLPPGPAGEHAVTWIQVEKEEDMKMAVKEAVQECGGDVVVLYRYGDGSDKEAAEASGADKVMSVFDFRGCEEKKVIYVTNGYIFPEATSRAMERLIIVTGPGLGEDDKAVLDMAKDTRHTYINEGYVKCEKDPCPWSKETFPLIGHKVFTPDKKKSVTM